MIVVTQLPFVAPLVISFCGWNALDPTATAASPAFDNYTRGVHRPGPALRRCSRRSLLTVTVVLVSLVLGLGLALLLDRSFRGRGIVRTLLIAPFLVVPVASALLWKHALYNPRTACSTAR